MRERYSVIGKWEGENLVWIFEMLGRDDHKISDHDLKRWLNKQEMPSHDRPYDGIIRVLHTDKYFEAVLAKDSRLPEPPKED